MNSKTILFTDQEIAILTKVLQNQLLKEIEGTNTSQKREFSYSELSSLNRKLREKPNNLSGGL